MSELYDALIVGGGPAGSSCALWLARLGLRPLVVEAGSSIGGLLNDTPFVNDWIVTQPGAEGPELAANIEQALIATGVSRLFRRNAHSARRCQDGFEVIHVDASGSKDVAISRTLVIATGVVPRSGGLASCPGVLIGPGTHIRNQEFAGRTVAILGGGDNAFENYQWAKRAGASAVHIYARTIRAGRAFAAAAEAADVQIGNYDVQSGSRSVNGRAYDLVLVMYGWEPRPVFVSDLGLDLDPQGHLRVDPASCETNATGVFAIGEVANRSHPCVVTAMADGVQAAKAIQRRIEAA